MKLKNKNNIENDITCVCGRKRKTFISHILRYDLHIENARLKLVRNTQLAN